MNQSRVKKCIYIFCVIALNLIEVVRNDFSFDWWSVATNLTGLVILGFLLTEIAIKDLLTLSSLVITILSVVSCFFASKIKALVSPLCTRGQVISAIFNVWWILIIFIYKIKEIIASKSKIKSSITYIIWVIASLWAIFSRSEAVWPVWILCMFSMFYFTSFSSLNWKKLWSSVIIGSIWFFVVFEALLMPFRPYDVVRHSGFMTNSNEFAKYLGIIYLFILVRIHMLHVQKKSVFLKILYVVIGGVNLCMTFMTACRTVCAIDIVITFIWCLGVVWKKWGIKLSKVFLGSIGAMILVVILLFPTYYAIRYVPTIHPHPIWFYGEYSEEKVHSWDPADSEKYVSFSEMVEGNLGRFIEAIFAILDWSPLSIEAEAKELIVVDYYDEIPSLPSSIKARITYARGYISKFNLLGNNSNETEFYFNSPRGKQEYIWHSQNFWIQVTYMFGIPYGILVVVIFALLFVRNIKIFRAKDDVGFNILPLMFMVFYFIYGLMEVTWLPGYMIFTLIYMVQHPQFTDALLPESGE